MEVLGRGKGILKSSAGYLFHHACTGVLTASHDMILILFSSLSEHELLCHKRIIKSV